MAMAHAPSLGMHVQCGRHAWGVMELARKYQVKRLELLCPQAISTEGGLGPQNAVLLLEGAHITHNEKLYMFAQCWKCIIYREHGVEVKQGGPSWRKCKRRVLPEDRLLGNSHGNS